MTNSKLGKWSKTSIMCSLFASTFAHSNGTEIFMENLPILPDETNLYNMPITVFKAGLQSPNISVETSYSGFDWTQPYPGTNLSNFKAHLRIGYDLPIFNNSRNFTTSVSALSFGAPPSLINSDGSPKAMHPSWVVCRTVAVSPFQNLTDTIKSDSTCNSLPQECLQDLKTRLSGSWNKRTSLYECPISDDRFMPESCIPYFGVSYLTGLPFSDSVLKDNSEDKDLLAKMLAVDGIESGTFAVGNGYQESRGNSTGYKEVDERFFLVAHAWGYNATLDPKRNDTPAVTFSCLSSKIQNKDAKKSGATRNIMNWLTSTIIISVPVFVLYNI